MKLWEPGETPVAYIARLEAAVLSARADERARTIRIIEEHKAMLIGHANCDPTGDCMAMLESVADALESPLWD